MAEAQQLYAQPRDITRLEDCFFYHVMELPELGLVGGLWDLREGVDQYLGGISVSGKRVLEIGPASGFLTMHLESRGAEVVANELGAEDDWDLAPDHSLDIEGARAAGRPFLERMRNSFWLTHRLFGSSARVHYGNAYALPAELGRFDVTTIASVLQHTRDPLRVIERCAQLTDEAIVIVDTRNAALDGTPVCLLVPSDQNHVIDVWWSFSPEFFVQYLGVLGFPNAEVTFHQHPWRSDPDAPDTAVPVELFTVVARR